LPLEKPQQPCWHCESDVQVSKTVFFDFWVAASCATVLGAAFAGFGAGLGAAFAGFGAALAGFGAAFFAGVKGRLSSFAVNAAAVCTAELEMSPFTAPLTHSLRPRAFATLQFGARLPKPQPPSRV
jgi:hypothetical protein